MARQAWTNTVLLATGQASAHYTISTRTTVTRPLDLAAVRVALASPVNTALTLTLTRGDFTCTLRSTTAAELQSVVMDIAEKTWLIQGDRVTLTRSVATGAAQVVFELDNGDL
jgi:hypothetical protein